MAVGHGLGLEAREYPLMVHPCNGRIRDDCIDLDADLPLEAGMILNIEIPYFFPPEGSMHIEQTFLVTQDGCEPLTEQNRTQPLKCGTGA